MEKSRRLDGQLTKEWRMSTAAESLGSKASRSEARYQNCKNVVYEQQLKFAGGHPPNYYAADTKLK
jgi:hypothetical protein